MAPERLALNIATLDSKTPHELKHLLLKEHRRIERVENDQNIVRMTNRWADKVLEAAECARESNVSAVAVRWDSKGKWRSARSNPSPSKPLSADETSPMGRSGTGLGSAAEAVAAAHLLKEDATVQEPAHTQRGLITGQAIDLGSGNDVRLGHMRGLLELMARKKMRMLEMQDAAASTKSTLDGMKRDVAQLLITHDQLAGGARAKVGKLSADKRKLRKCEAMRRDTLNVLSCCRTISQVKPIPAGWGWSNQRAVCGACRATLHKLQIQHSATEILARTVAAGEKKLAVTKKALSNVGSAVARVLDEAIYRPVTLTTQSATEECAHGIVFTVAATEHPIVVTAIKCARHPWSRSAVQKMMVLVSPIRTEEKGWNIADDLPAWTLAGHTGAMPNSYTSCLPCMSVFDSEACYGDVPLRQPFVVEVGTHRSVAIHSDDRHGILNRQERSLSVGKCSDSASCLEVRVGMVLGQNLQARLTKDTQTACFVGQLIYRRCPRQ